jgi:hypothetical protein
MMATTQKTLRRSGSSPWRPRSVAFAIESLPEYQEAVDSIIGAFVDTLFAADGDTTLVDVDTALSPLVPIVADELVLREMPVEVERIEDVVDTRELASV